MITSKGVAGLTTFFLATNNYIQVYIRNIFGIDNYIGLVSASYMYAYISRKLQTNIGNNDVYNIYSVGIVR